MQVKQFRRSRNAMKKYSIPILFCLLLGCTPETSPPFKQCESLEMEFLLEAVDVVGTLLPDVEFTLEQNYEPFELDLNDVWTELDDVAQQEDFYCGDLSELNWVDDEGNEVIDHHPHGHAMQEERWILINTSSNAWQETFNTWTESLEEAPSEEDIPDMTQEMDYYEFMLFIESERNHVAVSGYFAGILLHEAAHITLQANHKNSNNEMESGLTYYDLIYDIGISVQTVHYHSVWREHKEWLWELYCSL